MAEYLHLYRDDEDGTTEIDYDLRGSVYWLESDGWTPATMPDVPFEERATATEVLTLGVFATTAAGVADAIADLRRLLTEARRRASLERYPSTLTYLRHYPDGGSEDDYRTAEVVGGAVRWSKVLGRRIEQSGGTEYVAEVVVEVEHRAPLGEPETLKNLCPNPSFEWDVDDNGLANNWAEFGTSANQTPAIVAVDNAYGAYGQELTLTDAIAATTGVQNAATIAVTAETEYHLKAWVDNSDNTNPLYVQVWDSTGTAWIATSKLTFAAGAAGAQQSVSFSTPASCVAVLVMAYWANGEATSGDVAVVDGVYLGLKGDRAPQAWASYYSIQNHCDGAAVSTDHNWVDVADVPGECEAVLETVATLTVSTGVNTVLGGRRTGEAPWLPVLWLQAEAATDDGADWAAVTDAAASGAATNNAMDATLNDSALDDFMQWTVTDATTLKQLRGKYRPLLIVKRTGAAVTLTVRFYIYSGGISGDLVVLGDVTEALQTSFTLIRGPVVSLPANRPAELYGEHITLRLEFMGSAAVDLRVDALALVPVDECWAELPYMTNAVWTSVTGDKVIMSGLADKGLVYDDSLTTHIGPLANEGMLDRLVPARAQRLFLMAASRVKSTTTYDGWDKAEAFGVELTYRPRWLSL